ncbi:hypothetical protein [Wohlfahrtiimonas populi]|uniref:hypothetical protein n=1 Tax=Wohlfahrtiimonas populi TaxID=1940240 RepID=UPI00098D1076|nr:hypothetical protein [Wohlfahrtiimonas populi]
MKKVLAIIIYLTASLSFVHSEILDKINDDAFTYDYSGLCSNTQHCQLIKYYDICSAVLVSSCGNPHDFLGGYMCPVYRREPPIYTPPKYLEFPSEANANAFFNIHILNNSPNSQLGYLRWITYKFSDSIKSYIINFGATITEHLVPPLFPLYKTLNDITDNTFTYKYLWLCNDAMNCQFIKLSDICDTSPKPPAPLRFSYGHYYPETTNHDCTSFLSIPTLLQGFSSEADASINIQLFDSPTALKDKDKQNHSTKIKHDF